MAGQKLRFLGNNLTITDYANTMARLVHAALASLDGSEAELEGDGQLYKGEYRLLLGRTQCKKGRALEDAMKKYVSLL